MTAAELEKARASDAHRHEAMEANDRLCDAAPPESAVHGYARWKRAGMAANGVSLAPSKLDRPMRPATPIKATAPIKATTAVTRGTTRERTSASPTRAGPKSADDADPGGSEPPLDPFDAAYAAADALGLQPRLCGPRQASSRCASHHDRVHSLSIGEADDGRILLHCHKGCTFAEVRAALSEGFDASRPIAVSRVSRPITVSTPPVTISEAWVAECVAALHEPLTLAHVRRFNERLLDRRWTWQILHGAEVGWDGRRFTFPYRDAEGALTGAARYTDRPGRGAKTIAVAGSVRQLFPAPERIPGDDVVVVEGEPDAIAALSVGLPATGIPGANGWRSSWAPRFAGRRVVIVLDCDEPRRSAAARIAADLEGVAASVRVIELDQARMDGYDLTDVLRELAEQGRHVPTAVREVVA